MTSQFFRLFVWHVARNARRHPALAGLNVLSVALGVSVYLAIQIANHSANQSFAASIDLVAGKANLEVRSPSGDFDETLLPRLTHAVGVKAATPLVEGYATLPAYPGEYLQLLGVDIYTNLPFATFAIGGQAPADWADLNLESWLGDPRTIAITDEFARLHGLKVGDALRLQINGHETVLTIRFLIRLTDTAAGRGNSRVGALDLGWAQELLGKQGRLSSIQMLLDHPSEAEQTAAALARMVPADVTVAPPAQRGGQVERMLASFQLNLGALSLVSLLVGMFLIYNTIAASVVRRRVETGILRAVGATRLEVQCLFLAEALLLGLIGVAFGLVGGTLLARFLLGREIAKVISTLYLLVSVDRFYLTPLLVGSALFFGLGSVLAAAWLPAREGAMADPVATLSLGLGTVMEKSRLNASRWLLSGVAALLMAGICSAIALTSGPAWLGFGSAFFVLLGYAFMAPAATQWSATQAMGVLSRLEPWVERPHVADTGTISTRNKNTHPVEKYLTLLRLAAQNLTRSLHRNAVIVAALMAAVAMTVGISVMIHAFRQTVEVWINRAIVADIFMTPSANETLGNGAFFPPDVLKALQTDPAIRAVETVREIGVTIQNNRISLVVVAGDDRDRLAFVGGNAGEQQRQFQEPDRVLVSEPFAHRYHVKTGEAISIPTPDGVVRFIVAGVYYDYSRDSGIVAITRANFVRHWHDERVMSAAIYLNDPSQIEKVAGQLRLRFNLRGEFLIFSNRAIREKVFEIFGQTFRITGVLRGIAVVVAIIGIFLTLTTLVSEREREIGVLRAIGASARQIQAIVLAESSLIGLLAGILGVVAGLTLSLVLTFVINKAFFGWTIQYACPWATVLSTPAWIVGASVIAGWLPAVRAGKIPIAAAVRAE